MTNGIHAKINGGTPVPVIPRKLTPRRGMHVAALAAELAPGLLRDDLEGDRRKRAERNTAGFAARTGAHGEGLHQEAAFLAGNDFSGFALQLDLGAFGRRGENRV